MGIVESVSLVTKRRLFSALHCIWESVVATPAFILTQFVAKRLRSTPQILVSEFYAVSVTLSTG
jgi:hypothetical protein